MILSAQQPLTQHKDQDGQQLYLNQQNYIGMLLTQNGYHFLHKQDMLPIQLQVLAVCTSGHFLYLQFLSICQVQGDQGKDGPVHVSKRRTGRLARVCC